MQFTVRRFIKSLVITCSIFTSQAALAAAPEYPSRPITLLVGYGAGGGTDVMARVVAQRLSEELGQQVIVENRPGAAGLIAAEAVARSPADGYTLLVGNTTLLIMPFIRPNANSDAIKSLEQVGGIAVAPLAVIANNSIEASSPAELVELLRANPDKYAYGTPGVGSVQSVGFEMFLDKTQTDSLHVPYSGAAQVVTDVVGGQVQLGVASVASALPQINAGKLKAVALLGTNKLPGVENVPAMASVVPGYDVAERLTIMAPAGTPEPIVNRFNDALMKIINAPDLPDLLAKQGMVPLYTAPNELDALLSKQIGELVEVIQKKKIFID